MNGVTNLSDAAAESLSKCEGLCMNEKVLTKEKAELFINTTYPWEVDDIAEFEKIEADTSNFKKSEFVFVRCDLRYFPWEYDDERRLKM